MWKKGLFIAAVLLTIVSKPAFAQGKSFSVKIRLAEASTGEAIGYVTVSLTRDGEESVYKYAQTDEKGSVEIANVAAGKYRIEGILLGYQKYSEVITVNKNLDLGTKKMNVEAEFLEGATVSGVGNPIIVKKDTIEHNVAMMKMGDNDVLEDLLKRLPGVEVSSDGTITANGKTISKIQVDGREFFANDPQMASKNLPANMIEKVRVVEKKSDQAIFTGIDDGQETTVLDLGIKGGMMNGLMGNVLAGLGSDVHNQTDLERGATNDLRYQGNALLARFTMNSQTAFIGNANNGNSQGFTGMSMGAAGGGMGGMRGAGMGGGGITSSYMAGFNGGYTLKNKSEIIVDASGNGSNRYVENATRRITYNRDGSSLDASEDGYSNSDSYSLRASSRMDIKLTDKTSFIFEPNISYGWGSTYEHNDFVTDGTDPQGRNKKVNDGNSLSTGDNRSTSVGSRFMLRQRFSKAGRSLTIDGRYTHSDNTTDGINQSVTNAYGEVDESGKQSSTPTRVDQQFNQWSKSNSINARATYTEPFGKNFYGELNYSMNFSKSNSGKDTYNLDGKGQYSVRDDIYSSDITNTRMTNSAGFNFRKQERKYNFTVGANVEPNRTVNETHNGVVDTTLTLDVVNWSPQARVDFNLSDYKVIRINYRGSSSHPSINQLMPVPDNTNPLRVTLGNMDLNPSFTHNMDISYRVTNLKNFSSLNLSVNGSYRPRSIVNATWNDLSGVQYSLPMNNTRKTYTAGGNIMFNSPIGSSKFSVMSNTSFNYSNGISFVGSTDIDIYDRTSYLNIANYTQNEYQNVSANENLRFTYRDNHLEVTVGGSTRYSQAFYSVTSKNVPPTWTNALNANVIFRHDVINFSTDARYNFYKGYSNGYNDPTLVWNAEISKQVFRNTTTLAIRMYDILNQSKSTSRTTTDNYVLDSRTNTLGRYFMVSLTYRFGSFGGPGRGRGGFGGPRGGMGMPPMGGPGGGPMGGGPGGGGRGGRR